MPALLREHGILLLTSRYEASPTVVKEALRAMRPVVSTDVGDVADWLEHDRTGFVCARRRGTGRRRPGGQPADPRGPLPAPAGMEQLDESRLMSDVLTLYRQLAAR